MAFPNPNCEAGLEILVREQRKAEARSLLADELLAKDAEIERLKDERDQLKEEAVVKEENMEQATRNIARLKAELEACEASHDDEEAAHQETLAMLEKCKAEYETSKEQWVTSWLALIERFKSQLAALQNEHSDAAVEASLKPPSVRRWVSRESDNVVSLGNEKPTWNRTKWFVNGYGGYMSIEVAAAIGINLQPGECVLWDFTERMVVEVWKP